MEGDAFVLLEDSGAEVCCFATSVMSDITTQQHSARPRSGSSATGAPPVVGKKPQSQHGPHSHGADAGHSRGSADVSAGGGLSAMPTAAGSSTHPRASLSWASHLRTMQRDRLLSSQSKVSFSSDEPVHPTFVRLGLMYADRRIIGSTARATALVIALKEFVRDYRTPANKELSRDIITKLTAQIDYINQCRPKSIGMGSVLSYMKSCVAQLGALQSSSGRPMPTAATASRGSAVSTAGPAPAVGRGAGLMDESAAKEYLIERLDAFLAQRITVAHDAMVSLAKPRIRDTDVVLTFGRSHIVEQILLKHPPLRVVVVDSPPLFEGRTLLSRLVDAGIPSSYALLGAVSHMLRGVTKVLLGAHAMLNNGAMLSRAGCATVAMTAKMAYNVPIIVCCETFKFSEKAPLDALTINERWGPTIEEQKLIAASMAGLGSVDTTGLLSPGSSAHGHSPSIHQSQQQQQQRKRGQDGANIAATTTSGSTNSGGGKMQQLAGDMSSLSIGVGVGGGGGSSQSSKTMHGGHHHHHHSHHSAGCAPVDVLHLVYDVTPPSFIDMVLTEVGCIPPTSVPVVLRESKTAGDL